MAVEGAGLSLHHVATVVASVDNAVSHYEALGFRPEGAVVDDPVQRVRIQFLLDGSSATRLELLEPVGPRSPVRGALESGGGLHHLCYETTDLDRTVERLRVRGMALLSGPTPAPAISGAPVAFLYDRTYGLMELVESPALVTRPE